MCLEVGSAMRYEKDVLKRVITRRARMNLSQILRSERLSGLIARSGVAKALLPTSPRYFIVDFEKFLTRLCGQSSTADLS